MCIVYTVTPRQPCVCVLAYGGGNVGLHGPCLDQLLGSCNIKGDNSIVAADPQLFTQNKVSYLIAHLTTLGRVLISDNLNENYNGANAFDVCFTSRHEQT